MSAFAGITACGSSGPYVWYTALPPSERMESSGQFLIGVGDTVSIRVYEQAALATEGKIRPDGRIALPFIGEIVAAGKTPKALAGEIEAGLRRFIVNPSVTVNVTASPPMTITVIGEVGRQGILTMEPASGILEALAQAGGPSEFANTDRIFVLRRLPSYHRIRFTYDDLLENRGGAAYVPLQPGDVLLVE